MKIIITSLILFCAIFTAEKSYAQFWQGFMMGTVNALQNFQNQQNTFKTNKKIKYEDDGFVWYLAYRYNSKVIKDYGALDKNGRTLVPQRYDYIYYNDTDGWFKVEKDGKDGAYTKTGKIICDTKYKLIWYSEKRGFICEDFNGNEIVLNKDINGNKLISEEVSSNHVSSLPFKIKLGTYKRFSYTFVSGSNNVSKAGDDYEGTITVSKEKIEIASKTLERNYTFILNGLYKTTASPIPATVYGATMQGKECNIYIFDPEIPQLTGIRFEEPSTKEIVVLQFDSSDVK